MAQDNDALASAMFEKLKKLSDEALEKIITALSLERARRLQLQTQALHESNFTYKKH